MNAMYEKKLALQAESYIQLKIAYEEVTKARKVCMCILRLSAEGESGVKILMLMRTEAHPADGSAALFRFWACYSLQFITPSTHDLFIPPMCADSRTLERKWDTVCEAISMY